MSKGPPTHVHAESKFLSVIRYHCHHCGAEMESPQNMIGRAETCPACKAETVVPGPEHKEERPRHGRGRSGTISCWLPEFLILTLGASGALCLARDLVRLGSLSQTIFWMSIAAALSGWWTLKLAAPRYLLQGARRDLAQPDPKPLLMARMDRVLGSHFIGDFSRDVEGSLVKAVRIGTTLLISSAWLVLNIGLAGVGWGIFSGLLVLVSATLCIVFPYSTIMRQTYSTFRAIVEGQRPDLWDEISGVLVSRGGEQPQRREGTTARECEGVCRTQGAPQRAQWRCRNCGGTQRKGDWEEAMDRRSRALYRSPFINLGASEQCLKCGSTDLVDASAPEEKPEAVPVEVKELATRFSRAGRSWQEAHDLGLREARQGVMTHYHSTQRTKDEMEKEIADAIREAREKGLLSPVLRLLQRRGERAALYVVDHYL